jgi:hypothetical protein
VAQMVIDITNVVTLTVNEVLLVPNAGPNEPFATINSIDVDFANNSLLAGLGIEQFTITGSGVYADRLRLGKVEVVLDGTLRIGQKDLLKLEEFLFTISGIEIGGVFNSNSLNGTFTLNNSTPLVQGSLDDIQFSSDVATWMPGSDVVGGVEGLAGGVDLANGTVQIMAKRAWETSLINLSLKRSK